MKYTDFVEFTDHKTVVEIAGYDSGVVKEGVVQWVFFEEDGCTIKEAIVYPLHRIKSIITYGGTDS